MKDLYLEGSSYHSLIYVIFSSRLGQSPSVNCYPIKRSICGDCLSEEPFQLDNYK